MLAGYREMILPLTVGVQLSLAFGAMSLRLCIDCHLRLWYRVSDSVS